MSDYLKYTLLLCLTMLAVSVRAQSPVKIDSVATEIHFRWDKSFLDTTYLGNNRVISQLEHKIDSLGIENIDSVIIISQSSPEGPYPYNVRLSKRRAASMREFMEEYFPELSSRTSINPDGESWLLLRDYVLKDEWLSDNAIRRIVAIIDDDSVPIEVKKRRITNDPGYRYLYRTYYPIIRNSRILITSSRTLNEPILKDIPSSARVELCRVTPSALQTQTHSSATIAPILPREKDTLTFALKTNMLYDLATVLNAEIEVPIGNHWSVMVEDVFPWWERDNKYCLQMWEMGIEGRYWLSNNVYYKQKLKGHFLGLYGMSAKYDFQWDRKLCYQGEYWSAGLTYGYSLPMAKWLNFEFSISVGYLSTAYRHYYPAYDYSELWIDKSKMGRLGYFGPTKLKVSFVLPIHIQYNKMGGKVR